MASDPLKLGYFEGPCTSGNCSGYTFELDRLSRLRRDLLEDYKPNI